MSAVLDGSADGRSRDLDGRGAGDGVNQSAPLGRTESAPDAEPEPGRLDEVGDEALEPDRTRPADRHGDGDRISSGREVGPGLLEKHRDHDPLAVDALIYLLAVALQSPKPTATVALARGLSPASGPKRILAARRAGLLPETEPGKPAGV
jgi:hypothetical protein